MVKTRYIVFSGILSIKYMYFHLGLHARNLRNKFPVHVVYLILYNACIKFKENFAQYKYLISEYFINHNGKLYIIGKANSVLFGLRMNYRSPGNDILASILPVPGSCSGQQWRRQGMASGAIAQNLWPIASSLSQGQIQEGATGQLSPPLRKQWVGRTVNGLGG